MMSLIICLFVPFWVNCFHVIDVLVYGNSLEAVIGSRMLYFLNDLRTVKKAKATLLKKKEKEKCTQTKLK